MRAWDPAAILQLQSGRPAVLVTISFASGISFSLLCRQYVFWGLAAAGMILVVTSFLAYLRHRIGLSFILAQTALFMGGMLTGIAHRDGYDRQDLRSLLSKKVFPLQEPVLFEGSIAEGTPMYEEEIVIVVEFHRFRQKNGWTFCKGKGILRIASPDSPQYGQLSECLTPGTLLRVWAVWKIPRNFENPGSADRAGSLARRGIFLIGRTKSPRLIESISKEHTHALTLLTNSVRRRLRHTLEPIWETRGRRSAAILASLLIGDHSALDTGTRQTFQNAGSFHILVVSGLHVAWITGVLLTLAKLARIPERLRYPSAAVVILLYAWTVGFQAGVTRCLWMFYLYLAGRMIQRTTDAVNILFFAALLLLAVHPDRLYEAGYQLSFLSVMAIVLTAVPVIENWVRPVLEPLKSAGCKDRLFLKKGTQHRCGRWLRTRCELFLEDFSDTYPGGVTWMLHRICRLGAVTGMVVGSTILLSVAVQIWIAPLLAYYFNRISWIAPLSNPVVVPIASLTLTLGFVGYFTADIALIGRELMQLAGSTASLLLNATEHITRIPGAWQRCPTPSMMWIIAGILILFLWTFFKWKRHWIPIGYLSILLFLISCGSTPLVSTVFHKLQNMSKSDKTGPWLQNTPYLSLTFLDVGEGDSVVIRFPDKRLWILDAGGLRRTSSGEDTLDSFDIGEAVVSRYLWYGWTGNPDRIVLSHTDIDHAGGIRALLNNFKIRRLDYARCLPDTMLSNILQTARQRETQTNPVHAGIEEKIGDVTVRFLHPQAQPVRRSTNDNSVVLALSFKRFSALLTGDLEKSGEAELLSHPGDLRSLLLKVAHHGSRTGTSSAFLDVIQPRWAVLSVGRNNPFGHPSPEVEQRLARHGTSTYQTQYDGALTFSTDGVSYEIRSFINGILENGVLE
ncbi:MAG: ComEC/Rec2 family competence protein [Acidobacteriota bacterium]